MLRLLTRSNPTKAATDDKSPEQVVRAFLMRCMPTIPIGYLDDFGFEHRYLDFAGPVVEWRGFAMVLGSSSQDAENAKELAEALTECAVRIAKDFDAPDFTDGGFLDADAAQSFIEKWRENFTRNLAHAAVRQQCA